MKLTDILKENVEDLDPDLIEDLTHIFLYGYVLGIPNEIETSDGVLKLIKLVEENFDKFEYKSNYPLIEFMDNLSINRNDNLEDLEKEIFITEFIIPFNGKFYQSMFQTGYYNFPFSNELKEVQKKERIEVYYG